MPQSAVARKISVWYTGDNKSQGDAENKRQIATEDGAEMPVPAILRQPPDISHNGIALKIVKTVRTVQRALNSLKEKHM